MQGDLSSFTGPLTGATTKSFSSEQEPPLFLLWQTGRETRWDRLSLHDRSRVVLSYRAGIFLPQQLRGRSYSGRQSRQTVAHIMAVAGDKVYQPILEHHSRGLLDLL